MRNLAKTRDSFSKLASFSKFVGLPIDGFEEEILQHLRRLELTKKWKVTRQGQKKGFPVGSKFERKLQKLECHVNYK